SLSVALPFMPNAGAVFDFVRPASAGEGMPGSSDRVRRHIYDYTNGRYDDQHANTKVLEDVRSTTFAIEDSLFHSYSDSLAVWRNSTDPILYVTMRDWSIAHQQWVKAQYDALETTLETGGSPIRMVTTYRLHPNYPNPFNPVSTIQYDLPQASAVSLIVHDILGREVARLVESYMAPGYHQAQWNGRDQSGRSVPSGIYLARLVTPEYMKSVKMVLQK
ncbi:MAG: FlgD immunoglobulin-like domain containing protein, partial [Candidatus Neomarinimicrobiota bacterium]